ncbi:MAG: hypothetical protein IPO08_23605 [Xanthomonadales bacterium]|nr:hypothetical protein [Xanthomonadales bacterium]
MADPLLRRIVEMTARHIMRPEQDQRTQIARSTMFEFRTQPVIDQKSKASGEREEKDPDPGQT